MIDSILHAITLELVGIADMISGPMRVTPLPPFCGVGWFLCA